MNASIEQFIEMTEEGKSYDIATSEYSINSHGRWNPVCKMHHSTVKAMIRMGLVHGTTFWRGATVTRTIQTGIA